MTLDELFEESAERRGDEPFLLSEEGSVSYAEALTRAHRLAGLLSALGVRYGDRVAVILPNVPEMVYSWFALARLGAAMVPVNPLLVPAEVEPFLRHVGVCGILGRAEDVARYGMDLGLRIRVVVGEGEVAGSVPMSAADLAAPVPRAAVTGRDLATILQTSGTTGRAKGAELTHDGYVLPAREFVRWMRVTPEDRFLACLPLFHMAGGAFTASAVAGGAALALVPKFSAHGFWSQVRKHRVTVARHLGEMLACLCQLPESPEERGHSLRAVYGGGAKAEVADAFESRFGATVVEGYGLTETNTVLCNDLAERRRGAIGRPLPYNEVRIADAEGRPLPTGQVGEIQVRRNPVMMTGYTGLPDVTASCFVDGWFRTGDLGRCDEDGWFYFVSRDKDIIRRRGENIFAGKVEEVLNQHPAVALSAVVAVTDELGGEEVKAYVIPRSGSRPTPEELIELCHLSLADFEVPRYFELCDDLPRTPTNKISKGELRAAGTMGKPCFDRKDNRWRPEDEAQPASGASPLSQPLQELQTLA
ncbi:MAG TPA: AMP-binding protein [Thermoanaerobaculia bacterium]|nr:AMP-binding protein [Thermoanaerobaculia bacterium]